MYLCVSQHIRLVCLDLGISFISAQYCFSLLSLGMDQFAIFLLPSYFHWSRRHNVHLDPKLFLSLSPRLPQSAIFQLPWHLFVWHSCDLSHDWVCSPPRWWGWWRGRGRRGMGNLGETEGVCPQLVPDPQTLFPQVNFFARLGCLTENTTLSPWKWKNNLNDTLSTSTLLLFYIWIYM